LLLLGAEDTLPFAAPHLATSLCGFRIPLNCKDYLAVATVKTSKYIV
jgi:hypothetical protein